MNPTWVADPTLVFPFGAHVGHEPLGELLAAESKLMWSVLRRPDQTLYRMPPFTGWNIAVARVHVIAQAGARRVWVPVKLTNPDGKELVFLSGRCAADVMAYAQRHDQHVFDADVLRSLPDDYELIGFGQAFAAVSGRWDERDLDEQCALYATTLGIASAPETPSSWASGLYHSEEALIHLLRHRLSDIVRSALGGTTGAAPGKRRRVEASTTITLPQSLQPLAVVIDVATTRTVCRYCRRAIGQWLLGSSPPLAIPIYVRAVAEVWFEQSFPEAARGLQGRSQDHFVHTHHDAWHNDDIEPPALTSVGLIRESDYLYEITIPEVPPSTGRPGAPGSPNESLVIPPSDNGRLTFRGIRRLLRAGNDLAGRMISMIERQAIDRRAMLLDRRVAVEAVTEWQAMMDVEEEEPPDDRTDRDDDDDPMDLDFVPDPNDDDDDDSAFEDFLEGEDGLDGPIACNLGLISCQSAPPPVGVPPPASLGDPVPVDDDLGRGKRRRRD